MNRRQHRREIQRQACFDAGLLLSIAAVLFVYVLFFAFVFTDPPNLPSKLPAKPLVTPPGRLP